MAGWRSTKPSHSTGYSNAIVCPNNALIGGDNCGAGRKGGALFSNQRATGIKGEEEEEEDGRPGFLVRGGPIHRGGTVLGAHVGLSKLIIQMQEKRIVLGKK